MTILGDIELSNNIGYGTESKDNLNDNVKSLKMGHYSISFYFQWLKK